VLPLPGTGEILMITILVALVFLGEKVGAIGDAIGRARRGGRREPDAPTASEGTGGGADRGKS
jgi:hypothetical protein